MLSRACRPLLRQRALALPIQSSIPAFQSRRYAHNNKRSPTHNDNKTPSSKPPNQRSGFDGPSRPPPKQRDFSEEQVEFEHNETSKQNTPPKTTGAGPSLNRGKPERASSESEFSETQAEFETSSTPQSESGNEHATPKYPLPDLTKGIPSTIGAEMDALSRKQGSTPLNLTEDPTKLPEDELARAGAGGGGGVPKDSYVSSTDRRRNRLMLWAGYFLLANVLGGTLYMGRPWESEEEAKAHPNSLWFFQRIRARYVDFWKYYSDPAFEKLLPDGDPQYRPPYTLVLSLNDLLVHDEWSREHGWRTAKRPGVDYFLRYLSQYYELVLFTSAPSMIADLTLRSLDPFHIIQWPLFREATKYESGHYVKDLAYLNRDLSKVIIIDTDPLHAERQPENAIILPKWNGDSKDKTLVTLIPFLEYIAGMGIEDVRPVLKSFEGTDIPTEFLRRQAAMREKFEKQLAEERKKRPKRNIGGLASAFGIKRTDGLDAAAAEEGKMLWDQIRERGQKQYELMEKEIRENGEKWLAEMAAEEEKMKQEQMKGMKSGFTSFFGLGGSK